MNFKISTYNEIILGEFILKQSHFSLFTKKPLYIKITSGNVKSLTVQQPEPQKPPAPFHNYQICPHLLIDEKHISKVIFPFYKSRSLPAKIYPVISEVYPYGSVIVSGEVKV